MSIKSSIFPYIPNYLKFGTDYISCLKKIKQFELFSVQRKEELVTRKVLEIVHNAYNNVEFYHELYNEFDINIRNIQDLSDINKLPIVNKEIIKSKKLSLIYNNISSKELIPANTGGSTGEPLKLYRSKKENAQEYAYLDYYIGKALGRFNLFNCRKVIIRGETPENKLVKRYGCNLVVSSNLLSEDNINEVVRIVESFKPTLIHAYPSSLLKYINLSVCCTCVDRAAVELVLTSSECITSSQLNLISDFFRCHTLDLYGNSERSSLAININNQSYDFDMSYGYTELSKGGLILSTKLLDSPMPLIRYDCGDQYVKDDIRSFSIMSLQLAKIGGRSSEMLVGSDGNKIPVVSIIFGVHYGFFDCINDFSIVQTENGIINIEYVAREPILPSIIDKDIYSMREESNGMLTCKFKRVEHIRCKLNGKKDFLSRNN